MRFYCLREISWGQDGDWGREKFVNRNNADLANNFGNLAQRSLSMIAKNFGGQMPPRQDGSAEDDKIVAETITSIERMEAAMASELLHEATAELIAALSAANLYFADQAPWGKKDDLARMGAILATTADVVRRCAIAAQPFVPASAAKMLDLLAVPADQRLLQHALDPDLDRRRRHAAAAARAGVQEIRGGQGRLIVLIDSHCHLDFPELAADRAGVLARAKAQRRRRAW